MADNVLERNQKSSSVNEALDRAGINLRPGEFVVLAIAISFATLLLGTILFSPLVGLVLAGIAGFGARYYVRWKGERRRAKFGQQLGDTLLVLASSLRAGYGVQQALNAVAEEGDQPTAEEFSRAVIETRIGRDMVDALKGIDERVGNEDFGWVIRAIAINRELGGDLAEILDNVGDTIRDRVQLKGSGPGAHR